VGILEQRDAHWAWYFGLSYGSWYPDLGADLQTILRGFSEYANQALNDASIAFGHRQYKTGRWGRKMNERQLRSLVPYLAELASVSGQAVESAIYYRRHMWDTHRVDVRVEHPHTRGVDHFAQAVDGFLQAHPDLLFYSRGRVAPAHGGSEPFAPPPPAASTNGPPAIAAPSSSARQRRPSPPPPQPYGVSHAGAEALVAAWMEHLGATRVRVTQVSGDGGIDVTSRGFIVQVKNLASSSAVPVSAIRDLAGVASVDGRRAAMFTSGGYSNGGISFANSARIALFRYDAVRGTLTAANTTASTVRRTGME